MDKFAQIPAFSHHVRNYSYLCCLHNSGALPEARLSNRKEMSTESGGNKKKMNLPRC